VVRHLVEEIKLLYSSSYGKNEVFSQSNANDTLRSSLRNKLTEHHFDTRRVLWGHSVA
jgi:hypothetical protein